MFYDERYMTRAIELARDSAGLASPNPQVGCVLVSGGDIVGEGAHFYDGRDHAEIVALKQAGSAARGATAYMTLEPCSHHGRTGPCADALIEAGVQRCVIATADPNPLVSGRGIARLQAAGIEVRVGVLEAEARRLNDAFAWSIVHRRPFVTLKSALSVDGMLAPAPHLRTSAAPHWLTGPEARAEVQRMRHQADAIVTGVGTILADDPLLTDRSGLARRRPLLRVVLDAGLRTPLDSKLVASTAGDVLLICADFPDVQRVEALSARGVQVICLPSDHGRISPESLLNHLHARQITHVLLEAGAAINQSFLQGGHVQQAVLFYSESELGADAVPFTLHGPTPFELQSRMLAHERATFGRDVCVSGLLVDPWAALPRTVNP